MRPNCVKLVKYPRFFWDSLRLNNIYIERERLYSKTIRGFYWQVMAEWGIENVSSGGLYLEQRGPQEPSLGMPGGCGWKGEMVIDFVERHENIIIREKRFFFFSLFFFPYLCSIQRLTSMMIFRIKNKWKVNKLIIERGWDCMKLLGRSI